MAKEMRGIKRDGKGIGVKGEEKEGRGNRLSRLSSSCSFRHQHHDGYFSVYLYSSG